VAFQGAILELEVNTAQAGGFAAVPVWPMPTVNTAGMFVPSIPDRFTIPPGINIVSLTFNWSRVGASSGQYASFIRKNGSDLLGGANWSNVGTPAMSVTTGPISVSPGDYFQAMLNLIPGPATLLGVQTRFTCEILDASLTPPP
jgi:hypothetical protein